MIDCSHWDGICDCHFHVFGPHSLYPLSGKRSYTPEEASLKDYREALAPLHVQRFVLIQPSVYGFDNRRHLDAMKEFGDCARMISVLEPAVQRETIVNQHAQGVRGIRLNLLFSGGLDTEDLIELAEKIRSFGWHLQLLINLSELPRLSSLLRDLKIPLVFDHFGHFLPGTRQGERGFQELLTFLSEGIAWIKLSAPYRLSLGGPPYETLRYYTRELISVNSKQLLWGSDWPHPGAPETPCSLPESLTLLTEWIDDESVLYKILVENPAMLYGFPSTPKASFS